MEKECSQCHKLLSITSFRKKGRRNNKQRYRSECKKCYSKYEKSVKFRKMRRDYFHTPDRHKKYQIQAIARRNVKLGNIIKKPCEKCGKKNVEGHHRDYSKPLEVMWLCRKHHIEEHYPRVNS